MTTSSKKSSNHNTAEILIDPFDELYLHHLDHPTCSLSSKTLDEDNYEHCKRTVEVSLLVKNKLSFVNGSMKKPVSGSNRLGRWERCNNMVISWLLYSVVNDIAESIVYCRTAYEI